MWHNTESSNLSVTVLKRIFKWRMPTTKQKKKKNALKEEKPAANQIRMISKEKLIYRSNQSTDQRLPNYIVDFFVGFSI